MPFRRCKLASGKLGWKWGTKGKCYASKARADAQRRAIKAAQARRENNPRSVM